MTQQVYLDSGALDRLETILKELHPRSIFLVTGKTSFSSSGAKSRLTGILAPYRTVTFSDFSVNPKLSDVVAGIAEFQRSNADLIIAVGGGSVLDIGKLVRILAVQAEDPRLIVESNSGIEVKGRPLIAIPTTSGSGSEATHFAVVYIDDTKHSLTHEFILPDIAIVDPNLTENLPQEITAVSGMDAFSQAMESYWSIHSTDASKADAAEALALCRDNLARVFEDPSPESRQAMSRASHLAGRAINVTKTTAPHALSYTITTRFGIPHGHAVGVTLGEFLRFNAGVTDHDVNDSRGRNHVSAAIGEILSIIQVPTLDVGVRLIRDLMNSIGLQPVPDVLTMDAAVSVEVICRGINLDRLSNNPRKITTEQLHTMILSLLSSVN
ncbi:phosphonoacetaldehyde reductase [Gemmatimonadota bacterium]